MTALPLNAAVTAYEIFDTIQNRTILGGASGMYHLALALGSLLCCVYLVYLSDRLFRGAGGWTPWDIVKPIVILMLVENFSLVVGVVDGTIGVVCKGIAGYAEEQFDWDVVSRFEQTCDRWAEEGQVSDDELRDSAETDADSESGGILGLPSLEQIWSSLKDWLFDTAKEFLGISAGFGYSLLAQAVASLAEWIGFILLLFSRIYLLVLAFLGPFVFAISIIPSFQNGIGQWIARYLQISFWYPILQVVNLVYVEFVSHIPDMIAGAQDMDDLLTQSTFASLMFLFASIACIFMYFSVPKTAAWLIQSTGTNSAHSNAGRAATAAAATVAKAVIA